MRRLPGPHRKYPTAELFRYSGSIRGVETEVIVDRPAVCERVVVGTTTVTRQVPAPDVEVPMIEVTEDIEQVEWRCQPLLDSERDTVAV